MNRIGAALVLWGLAALAASTAQASDPSRLTAAPRSGDSLRAGERTTLRFSVEEDVEEMELLLSLDGGRTFSLRVTREMSPGTHELSWRVPNLPSTRARLALRVGDEEEGEVVRDVSGEFTILPADNEPLEEIRQFREEWRAGEALEEIPFTAPFDAPDLAGAGDSIRAVGDETDLDRAPDAAPTCAPPDSDPDSVEPIHSDRVSMPSSPRLPLIVPKRE